MVIDGTYLSIFKPMVNVGGEIIASDVIVPGSVTTLSDPNADLRAINVGSDLRAGLETLAVVEKSINESSQEPLQEGASSGGDQTAFEISRLEQNANTILGLFLQMIAKHVKDFGKLRLGDNMQYLTVPEVIKIEDDMELVYKTFFLNGGTKTRAKAKKIVLDKDLPDETTEDEYLSKSYDIAEEEQEKDMEIAKVNPTLFRELKYMVLINPDVLNPRSEDLERAYDLETYDRMVAAPPGMYDPDETAKLLLGSNKTTKNNPEKYIAKKPTPGLSPMTPMPGMPMTPPGTMPQAGNSPLNAMGKKNQLSPTSTPSPVASPLA